MEDEVDSTNLINPQPFSTLPGALGHNQGPPADTFFKMVKLEIAPEAKLCSATILLAVTLTLTFGLQVALDGLDARNAKRAFLPINQAGVVTSHLSGAFDKVRQSFQLWRLASASLAHADAYKLLSSIACLLFWGFWLESLISSKLTVLAFAFGGAIIRHFGQHPVPSLQWFRRYRARRCGWRIRNFRIRAGLHNSELETNEPGEGHSARVAAKSCVHFRDERFVHGVGLGSNGYLGRWVGRPLRGLMGFEAPSAARSCPERSDQRRETFENVGLHRLGFPCDSSSSCYLFP